MNELTFNQILKEYLEYIQLYLKPTSYLNVRRKIVKHIKPFFRNKKISMINEEDYIKWQKKIIELNYSESFNNTMQGTIKAVFNYMSNKYGTKNIPSNIKTMKTYRIKEEKEKEIWNIHEYKKFIKKVDQYEYKVLFETLYFTGMRKGEILALRFKDIQGRYIRVNKTITKEYINGSRLEMTPKTKKSIRKIPIDLKLRFEIKKLQRYYNKKLGYFNEDFYLFGATKPIAPTTLERKKDNWCNKAKVKKISIHGFRHSHATMLYKHKIDPKEIQKRLGHSRISTTLDTYIHLDNKEEKRVQRTLISLHIF